jgi:hypothetical protein
MGLRLLVVLAQMLALANGVSVTVSKAVKMKGTPTIGRIGACGNAITKVTNGMDLQILALRCTERPDRAIITMARTGRSFA